MLDAGKIVFLGSGAMGEAMIKGMLAHQLTTPERVTACDPWQERLHYIQNTYQVQTSPTNLEAVAQAAIVVLSVKPQVMDQVASELHGHLAPDSLVLSIIAGIPIAALRRTLGHERIVRAMPNTPGQLGKGISVWTATSAVAEPQREQARAILGALGEEIWVADEGYVDMATALSGSGPGFIFLIIEALIDAGVHLGFSRPDAQKLVLQTIEGSVALVRETQSHPADLKNKVTSPGGTTAAGLYELEKGGLRATLSNAVYAAYRRSRELGALSESR